MEKVGIAHASRKIGTTGLTYDTGLCVLMGIMYAYCVIPIADISKLFGHESVDTTMIYVKSSFEDVKTGHKKYIV